MNSKHRNDAPPLMLGGEFKDAFIGTSFATPTSGCVAVYDWDAMVASILMREGGTRVEAEQKIRMRYLEKYLGTQSPVIYKRKETV